jgi:hypothetical protein
LLSDNGTNFDNGAKFELDALHKLFADPKFQTDVKNFCAQQQIEFHFIPPHFGGGKIDEASPDYHRWKNATQL